MSQNFVKNFDIDKSAEDTAGELPVIPGHLPHRTRFEGSFDSQHAEGGQNAENAKFTPRPSFWARGDVLRAREQLDVWAAYEKHLGETKAPTVDRILGKSMPSTIVDGKGRKVLDPRTGMAVVLDSVSASTSKLDNSAFAIHLDVEARIVNMRGPFIRAVLLAIYPRVGPMCEYSLEDLPIETEEQIRYLLKSVIPPVKGEDRNERQKWIDYLASVHRGVVNQLSRHETRRRAGRGEP